MYFYVILLKLLSYYRKCIHDAFIIQETDDLILINIDNGSVSTSCSDTLDLPEIPPAAADCFTQRCVLP